MTLCITYHTDNEMNTFSIPNSVSLELNVNNAYDLSSYQKPHHPELSAKDTHVCTNNYLLRKSINLSKFNNMYSIQKWNNLKHCMPKYQYSA